MKHILLVDGMALLFRGFYATYRRRHSLLNDAGVPINGVHQFVRYFFDCMLTFQPTHVIFCWDEGKTTFRNELYEPYKTNRPDPPKELIPQFSIAKKVVQAFSLPNVSLAHFEADDIIGTIATNFPHEQTTIQTGDRDLLQLVNEHTQVALMKKGLGNYDVYHIDNFYEKVGLSPEQYVDFKGLTGDPADYYPGIKGIGEKTALKLLQQFDSFEVVLQHKDKLTPRLRNNIMEEKEMFYISRHLAKVKCDVPVDISLDEAKFSLNVSQIEHRLNQIGIHFPLQQFIETYR